MSIFFWLKFQYGLMDVFVELTQHRFEHVAISTTKKTPKGRQFNVSSGAIAFAQQVFNDC